VAAGIALVAAGQMKIAPAAYADANGARAMTVADTRGLSQGSAVQCQPYEEAVLRRAFVNGREMAEVTCITRMEDRSAYMPQPVYAAQPVVRTVQPAVRTVQRPAARRVANTQPYEEDRRVENKRSWGKTAMIIGGSSGAGAGVGALVGGKKGALIGAAIGGGAATIYESTKR
jgi:hypothetical protein